ncbi:MAG TPA: YbhB/YbcL family Raf kinase inhibitor-like protein [Gammaproteobacteria bacterium]|nr:YbhB/YbcL family Raf kinase inhibitor-like protein [Gammaproteobacteria bacterium]
MPFEITSPDFQDNHSIPSKFTCEGTDEIPTLIWQDFPDNTESLALIVDDPDAPNGDWVHWVFFNIPPYVKHLSANSLPSEATNGINSWGNSGYGGPCPPTGEHRYFFKLYALDTILDLTGTATKKDLLAAMDSHILDSTQLMGLYKKHLSQK